MANVTIEGQIHLASPHDGADNGGQRHHGGGGATSSFLIEDILFQRPRVSLHKVAHFGWVSLH